MGLGTSHPAATSRTQVTPKRSVIIQKDMNNGLTPDVKNLQAKVQSATAALGECSSAEG